MYRYSRWRLVVMMVALFVLASLPALAQDAEPLGAGEGAPIVEPNFGGDIATLNPILITDGSSTDVARFLFPGMIANDPDTGLAVEGGDRNNLVDTWEISEDGLTYTFTLRDDLTWSDGTPITSADPKYAFDAIASGEVDSPFVSFLNNIESVEAPDPTTLVVTFKTADCNAIDVADTLPIVPSVRYQEAYPTFTDMTTDSEYNLNPDVTAGPFTFSNFRPGEQVTLIADQNYKDSPLGYVVPEGWVYKTVADQIVGVEQFLAGDITLITSVPDDRADQLKEMGEQGLVDYREAPSASWNYLIFNTADPTNPQNGLDEDGNPIDQGHHPLFGDVRVRQAFALSIDHDALNAGAFNGRGTPIGSPTLPQSWAYNSDVEPWPYDPEQAMALLDEAGFVDDDGNPDTVRVANEDALYAEPGTPLEFSLTTFQGNPTIDASSVLMQDQVSKTGFKMNLDVLEFQAMLPIMDGQTFDTIMLFLGPFDPNNPGEILELLDPVGDALGGAGFNAGSYSNERFSELVKQSRQLPGCDIEARKELLGEAQQIIRDELPVYFLTNAQVPYVAQTTIEGYDPRARSTYWNIPVWSIRPQ